jgi:hypothetical protein
MDRRFCLVDNTDFRFISLRQMISRIRNAAIFLGIVLAVSGDAYAERRVVWQTLHDYDTIIEPENSERQKRQLMNPFLSYTNIGTDFGFVGPGEQGIGWRSGQIGASLGDGSDEWAGIWHSMARLARMSEESMNFAACYPAAIESKFQPRVTGLRAVIRGKGKWKIDLSDAKNKILWSTTRVIDHAEFQEEIYDVPTDELLEVKTLTWIAEPGADLDIERIELRIEAPEVSTEQWWFLASYAKALTCYSASTGLVRDRAHIDDGSFDSISSTGLFCLATAAASSEGIVSRDFAHQVIRRAHEVTKTLRGPYGLLPHFVKTGDGGKLVRHEGTEYSTIDTSLFDLSLILSAKMLGDEALLKEFLEETKQVRLKDLINDEGYVSHGVESDGKTVIPYHWRDWGGETALVLVMLQVSNPGAAANMSLAHRPHQGTGFIAEIQSLFFPDFDSENQDALSGANWREVRKALLRDQKEYFSKKRPDMAEAIKGLYGFSAGEQKRGDGYAVGGVDLEDQMLVHPHYVLMAAAINDEPDQVRKTLELMERKRVFTVWGMVENISLESGEILPMIGSLNACFEALGAYHFLKKTSGEANVIYDASSGIPEIRRALKVFYP